MSGTVLYVLTPLSAIASDAHVNTYTTQPVNVNKTKLSNSKIIETTDPANEKVINVIISEDIVDPEIVIEPKNDLLTKEVDLIETVPRQVTVDQAPQKLTTDDSYILGSEDKIKVTVYGEKDLSSDYKIGSDGAIAMPLIGTVIIENLSLREAENLIENRLRDGYLKKPSVSIEVQESRPFYIMGEVRRPGSYNYIGGMNVLQAIAISGGFTYRANRKEVDVIRGNSSPSKPKPMKPEDIVQAGDIIFVRERFF